MKLFLTIIVFLTCSFSFAQGIFTAETLFVADTLQKEKIDEVKIEGKSNKRQIENSGFAAQVIETQKFASRNLQVNELLGKVPGVKVRQSGGIGSEANYNLNGMSGRSVGVFIDGIEISTYGSSFNLQSIPPSQIERIEIYKGVLPIHLSGDLLGGAINVVLKKEGLGNQIQSSISYGSFNTFQADLAANYRDQKSGYFFKVSGFHTYSDNDYEVWGKFVRNEMPDGRMVHVKGKRFNDAFRSSGGRVETGFTQVSWADQLLLSYNGSDTYNEVQHGQYMSKPYMGRFTKSQAHIGGLNYVKNNLFLDGLDLQVNGVLSSRTQQINDTVPWAYNWYGEKIIGLKGDPIETRDGGQQGKATLNRIQRSIVNLRSGINYQINNSHKISFNHTFYTVDRDDSDPLKSVLEQKYVAKSNLFKNVYGFNYEYLTWENRLHINAFAKIYQQHIDRTEPIVEVVNGKNTVVFSHFQDNRFAQGYGGTLSFKINRQLNVIGSAEKAVRMPSEGEIFGQQAENLLANIAIKPEISTNLNLGFRWNKNYQNDLNLQFYASGFIRNAKDKIAVFSNDRSVGNVETLNYINLDRTQSIGFESEISAVYKKWDMGISLSRFNSLFKNPEIPKRHNIQVPNEPFFTTNANLSYSFSNIQLHYFFSYVQSFNTIWDMSSDNSTWVPDQFINDIGASYSMMQGKYVISFDAKNIFNEEVYDNFAAQKPGRAFYLKFNYSLQYK